MQRSRYCCLCVSVEGDTVVSVFQLNDPTHKKGEKFAQCNGSEVFDLLLSDSRFF